MLTDRNSLGQRGKKLLDPLSARWLKNAGLVPFRDGRGPVVLMYHGIDPGSSGQSWKWSLPVHLFASHLKMLKRFGWTTLTARELINPDHVPAKSVVITFDDGYQDNYDQAFPLLKEFGMKATWFVVTRDIGSRAGWPDSSPFQRRMLNASQLLEMHASGMEIASHTCSHADLSVSSEDQARFEIERSKKELEDLLGEPVFSFAYPFGRFTDKTVCSVEQAGYSLAFITNPGWIGTDWQPFRIRRVAVFSYDTSNRLARKIAFADTNITWPRIIRYLWGRIVARIFNKKPKL